MTNIQLTLNQLQTAIDSLEDYIAIVTREHERYGLVAQLNVAVADTAALLDVFKCVKNVTIAFTDDEAQIIADALSVYWAGNVDGYVNKARLSALEKLEHAKVD